MHQHAREAQSPAHAGDHWARAKKTDKSAGITMKCRHRIETRDASEEETTKGKRWKRPRIRTKKVELRHIGGGGASRIKLCAELVELTFLPVRGAASPLAGGSALVLLQREEERKAKEMSRDGC